MTKEQIFNYVFSNEIIYITRQTSNLPMEMNIGSLDVCFIREYTKEWKQRIIKIYR